MKLTWPSPQEYNEAVQNPQICFADAELKSGQAELTPLGLPKPATGSFASVYRFYCGRQSWAVRCFVKAAHDLELRYQKIHGHLHEKGPSYAVGFEYLPNGIRLKGRYFPLVKMEWAHGAQLDEFVRCHYKNSRLMLVLSQLFLRLCLSLLSEGVAHGDLQHGNIMITEKGLKLIDYDGMFVPALSGLQSSELGHRHYQLPSSR